MHNIDSRRGLLVTIASVGTATVLGVLSQPAIAQNLAQLHACRDYVLDSLAFSQIPKSEVELSQSEMSATGTVRVYWQIQTQGMFGYCQVGDAPHYAVYNYGQVGSSPSVSPRANPLSHPQGNDDTREAACPRPNQLARGQPQELLLSNNINTNRQECWVNTPS
jgi:hypothetical protein